MISINFLSCLCGSQPDKENHTLTVSFLSCLCGSQPHESFHARAHHFLSCLCGSQRVLSYRQETSEFLSCLCGSQHRLSACTFSCVFLSCLCGSQLQKKVKELRRHRGKTHLHLFYPKFQQGARKADRIGFSCIGQKFWSKFRDRSTIAQAIGAQCSRLLYLTGCLLDEEGKGLHGR